MKTTIRSHTRLSSVLVVTAASLMLAGCNKALAPQFEAVGVEEIERDNNRSVIAFTVRAMNPNADPIPLRTVTYQVRINGDTVYQGLRSPETTLHNFSDSQFVLPAVVPAEYLSGSIDYALQGSVQYIPPGRLSEVLFDAEVSVPEAILDIEGTIETGS
jgi:LEA14-like dessication related protein